MTTFQTPTPAPRSPLETLQDDPDTPVHECLYPASPEAVARFEGWLQELLPSERELLDRLARRPDEEASRDDELDGHADW